MNTYCLLQAKETAPPPPSPVTEDNQFERLAEAVTPLCEVMDFRHVL